MEHRQFARLLPIAALLAATGTVQAMSHTSAPSYWRFGPDSEFNGASMNGVARLMVDTDMNWNNGYGVCSGTLLSGGNYVLTAAHCADSFQQTRIDFGVTPAGSLLTRGVSATYLNPYWNGSYLFGTDLAILKLDQQVTDIQGFRLSTTSNMGAEVLMMGYGTTTTGAVGIPDWNEWGYGHWGLNRYEVTTRVLLDAAAKKGMPDLGVWSNQYGEEYVSDFDGPGWDNTLQVVANRTGHLWTSDNGIYSPGAYGRYEAAFTGGDSGGGDFVWDGDEWLLAGVHSWNWDFCTGRIMNATTGAYCDSIPGINGSFGELMGATAIYSQVGWINSIVGNVPEPGTYSLMILGLLAGGALGRRRVEA